MQLIWSACTCALPYGLVTAASHYKLEVTATVYIITHKLFCKTLYIVCSTSADSSRVLRDKGQAHRVTDPAINT